LHTGTAEPIPVDTAVDTFTRTAADIIGTTPGVGATWQNPGSSAGSWSLDGTSAVRSAGAVTPEVYFRGTAAGEMRAAFQGVVLSTVGAGASTFRFTRFISQYVDTNNYVYAQVGVSPGGGRSFGLVKRIGGVTTPLVTEVADPAEIPYNSAAAALSDIVVEMTGTTVKATIGATVLTGTLTTAERDLLRGGNGLALRADAQPGMKVAGVAASILGTAGAVNTLTLYNGAVGGTTLAYQLPKIAAQCPVTPDLVMIASSHNYATTTADYLASVLAFVEAARTRWPGVGVVIVGQNPRFPPAGSGGNSAHLERLAAVRSLAANRGWGYVPVAEEFHKLPDQGRGFFSSVDGVHPLDAGYQFWGDLVIDWFTA
jgi:lysophospholipase L1-like esterase